MGICPLDNAWQASKAREPVVIGKPFAGSALIEKAAYRLTLILCIVIIGLHCFFYQDGNGRIDSFYNDIAQCLERTEMPDYQSDSAILCRHRLHRSYG